MNPFTNLQPCPRCTRLSHLAMCKDCDNDIDFEKESGMIIPEELWPIEGAAELARAVEATL